MSLLSSSEQPIEIDGSSQPAGFVVSSRRTSLGDSLFESLLFNKLNGDLRTFNPCLKEMVLLESGNYRNLKRNK